KYWLQLASQPFSGLSLPTLCRSPLEPPSKLSMGTEASISIGTSFLSRDFTFSRCHLHITLNQNPQWARRRENKKNKTTESKKHNCGVTVLSHAHQHFMKWRCDKILTVFTCVSMRVCKRRG
ncbi:hypothetical protein ILYODFUR_001993, partial [Ilyodon furcidens]